MPQKFVNLENLTSFWGNAKEYIDNERQEIEDQLYNWQKTEKAPMVQCKPVPNSELHPIVEFKFKETLPEGEKSPSNPSIIEGVNKITVDRQSKNLLIYNGKEGSQANLASVGSDGTITLNGTFTGENASTCNIIFLLPWSSNDKINFNVPLGKYFLSCNNPTTSNIRVSLRTKNGVGNSWANVIGNDGRLDTINKTRLITVNSETTYWYRVIVNIYDGTYNNYTFKLQLEQGESATSYETNDNNRYTIQLGDTYYGGSVDLSAGTMTVTVGGSAINTFSSASVNTNTIMFGAQGSHAHGGNTTPSVCACNRLAFATGNTDMEHWRQVGFSGDTGYVFFLNKSRLDVSEAVDPSNPTNAEWLAAGNAWLADNPIFVASSLVTPYTVTLTPTQIRSLPALDKYEPRINTVYTDQEVVQVGYQKYADDPAPLWYVKDMLRANVEAMTSGRNTIVRDVYDIPHVMVVVPKFLLSDIVATWPSEPHQAFIVGDAVKSEILIGKYLASQSAASHVLTMAHKAPWASINFDSSLARCRELGAGFGLVTNAMWVAYALYLWKLFGGTDSGGHVYHGNSNYGRDYSDHFQRGVLKNGTWNHGDTGLADAATLTGSGPVEWSADETPWGVCDLVGNVWEWVAGLRLSDGEIQILPNNDAILAAADMGAGSTQWRAIAGDPDGEDDGLADPGDEGTFKYDGNVADTKTSFVNAGAFRLNTELVNQNDKGFYQNSNFSGLVAATGVTAPEMLKQLALFPIGSGAVQGTVFACNKGERLAFRGGAWTYGLGAGPFALTMGYPRTLASRSLGFRAGFIS